jgi:outer membrane protein OmpA-like peptidoglycan-associated protein
MRKLIIALSILFFALSGIVIFKALGIPATNASYRYNREGLKPNDVPPRSEEGHPAGENDTNQGLMDDPQVKIPAQGNGVSTESKETQIAAEDKGPEKKARVLAVFDGKSFLPGQVLMNYNMMSSIKELSQNILAVPEYHVSIEGHSDSIPITASPGKQYRDNMDLSYLRAKTVARILTEQGVAADRISVIGYGDTRPIASNETKEGRARNRRVEVKLVPLNKEL